VSRKKENKNFYRNKQRQTHKIKWCNFSYRLEKENVKYSSILYMGILWILKFLFPIAMSLQNIISRLRIVTKLKSTKLKSRFPPRKKWRFVALYNIDIKSEANILATASVSIQTFSPDTWVGDNITADRCHR
jgi:hypothetical protein